MDRLDSRVGIVDRGRKRPQRDVNELPHAEADVLLQGALITDPDAVLNGGGQRRWVGRLLLKGGAPGVRDRAAQSVKVYSPLGTTGKMKLPASLLVVVRVAPVSTALSSIVALAMAAPLESNTDPATEPAVNCPKAGMAHKSSATRMMHISIRLFRMAICLLWQPVAALLRPVNALAPQLVFKTCL